MSQNFSNDMIKEVRIKNGAILILREPTVDDAEKIIEYLNAIGGESDNLLFGEDEFHLTVDQEIEYIKNLSNTANTIMVLGFIKNDLVSMAQISGNSRKRIAHNGELAISVKKEHWGKGIGSMMMEELIRFAKEQSSIKNINLGVKNSNDSAIKMYEKYGFVKIGIHKNYFNVNGVFDDEILMDLYL